MVVGVFIVHLVFDFAQDHSALSIPGFVWILLLFVPVTYAGTIFGLVGSFGTALVGIVVFLPSELLLRHSAFELWGARSIFATVLVASVLLGYRFEQEHSLSQELLKAEKDRGVDYFEGHPLSWQHLFEELPYGIALIDPKGFIRYVNERLEVLSGYPHSALIDQSVEVLVPPAARAAHVGLRQHFMAASMVRQHGANLNLALLRHDSAELPVDIGLAPLPFEDEVWTVAMIRDDTPRAAAEEARGVAERYSIDLETMAGQELARSERRFRLAFDNNTAGMAISDLDGRLLDANRACCEMLGYSKDELLKLHLADITHPEDRSLCKEMNRRLVSEEVDKADYSKRYIHKDGHVVYGKILTGIIKSDDHSAPYLVASIRDITEERTLTAQLSHQQLHDPLTGLPNRVLLKDRLIGAYQRALRDGGGGVLLLLDLDDFKGVNDTLGHQVGDQLLVAVAARLGALIRPTDTLYRFGGDEFIFVAEGRDCEAGADELAKRLLDVFVEPFRLDGSLLEQRASIGVVCFDIAHGDQFDTRRIQEADTAMYEAKRQGKARYVKFAPEMRERTSSRFNLAQELAHALVSEGLSMYYQPIVDLATGHLVGFEALMRWQHAERGWVPPDVFIPLAEQSDLILKLGTFALERATVEAASWQSMSNDALTPPYVAVNLSARQFHDPNLLSIIEHSLALSGLAPQRLVLEITESVALSDIESAISVIERLKSQGIALALDDFGTGYSSLSYLAKLRPRTIKIDRSFVSPVHSSTQAEQLLEAMISLCHTLDMTVVAEGIETEEQLELLRGLGCEFGQGYLFSPAVPALQVPKMGELALRNWKVENPTSSR
jgi:diguanylate cyclase (GGDEF)-like protein/PAS domain S-box-containing protein